MLPKVSDVLKILSYVHLIKGMKISVKYFKETYNPVFVRITVRTGNVPMFPRQPTTVLALVIYQHADLMALHVLMLKHLAHLII